MAGLSRKTVTVLFSDVVDSTPLGESVDPEAVRAVLTRLFDEMRIVIHRHGGTIEKVIGDEVMAVFGIPQVHEDDAVRAVRAAAEMRESLAALNERERLPLRVRTALNTGEVVAGDGHTLVTGDAVNTAARLRSAARPGEILVGRSTYNLVRDAVLAEPLEPLSVKGKSAPVDAWRVTAVIPDAPGRARRLDSPLVGRETERALLLQAYARAVGTRSCHMFTVLGAAGVGKSRLLNSVLDEMKPEATSLVGRCLAYGDGITYWPLRDVVHDLDLAAHIDAADVAAVHGAIGVGETVAVPPEDIQRAVRRLAEALARTHPIVLGFDELHWAEPTFLDLVEHLADAIRDAPVLLVCLARPELLEERPSWAGGKLNSTTILLEPLDAEESDALVARLGGGGVPPDLRRQIAEVTEGNPLFIEEMVGMALEDPSAVAMPPTIQALLTARIERLAPEEQRVLAAASIAGRFFSRAAVRQLAGTGVDAHLDALERKELIRAQPVPFADGDGFRFRHILIRDAAYDALPKAQRAAMHERLADWLEEAADGRQREVEELVGWHLEHAARYHGELGHADDGVSARAAAALAAAGQRAADRGDLRAASSLLTRATILWRDDERKRLEIAPPLAAALGAIGELEQARGILTRALESETAAADARLRAHIALAHVAVADATAETVGEAERAIQIFAAAGDDLGLSKAHQLLGHAEAASVHFAAAAAHMERSLVHARRAQSPRQVSLASNALATALYFGPVPASEAIARCEQLVHGEPGAAVAAVVRCIVAALLGVQGRMAPARAGFESVVATFESLGVTGWLAYARLYRGVAELGAGALEEAVEHLSAALASLERAGDNGLAMAAAYLARARCALGATAEAERLATTALAAADADQLLQAVATGARARIALAAGAAATAVEHARSAVDIAARGDASAIHADVLIDLAEALDAHGDSRGARAATRSALRLYDEKGHLVGVASAQRLAGRLTAAGVVE